VRVGTRLYAWNTNPIFFPLISASLLSGSLVISIPSIKILPDVGKSKPPSMPNRVLFPEPEGPIKATISLFFTVRSIPRKIGIWTLPRV